MICKMMPNLKFVKINKGRIKYSKEHRKAFRIIEKQLLGYNTVRSLFHDLDKIILYNFFEYKTVHDFHTNHMKHHSKKAKSQTDFIQMVIDWECARFTKPDKPLNARETLYKFYPELEDNVIPILETFGL